MYTKLTAKNLLKPCSMIHNKFTRKKIMQKAFPVSTVHHYRVFPLKTGHWVEVLPKFREPARKSLTIKREILKG